METRASPKPLKPGELYPALLERTRRAIACGALRSIETEQRCIEEAGVRFLVRSVSSLRRKSKEKRKKRRTGKPFNPFLPPEPELTVGALSATHTAVLNKFNVLEQHLLIVTRHFEHQETLLTRADFEALWCSLREIDGLGFYNGGAAAGASQTHKHLQLVPLPLTPDGPPLPMEPLLHTSGVPGEIVRIPQLPFRHRFCRLPEGLWRNPGEAAALSQRLYRAMLQQCAIAGVRQAGTMRQSAPYNLLLRRGWMLLVPRAREHFGNISVNGLGYAGSLFVRDTAELQLVTEAGPMGVLAGVSLQAGGITGAAGEPYPEYFTNPGYSSFGCN
jgi:ATP adenylyltransferase